MMTCLPELTRAESEQVLEEVRPRVPGDCGNHGSVFVLQKLLDQAPQHLHMLLRLGAIVGAATRPPFASLHNVIPTTDNHTH